MNMKCRHDFEFLEKFVFDDDLTSTFLYCRKCLAVCEVSIEVINHKAGEYDVAMNLLDDLVIRKGSEVKKKAKESGEAGAKGKGMEKQEGTA